MHTKGNVNPPHLIHTSRKRPPIPSLFRLNTPTSAFPNSRPRGCVAGPRWRIRPDQARVIRLVRAGERDQGAGGPRPAARDAHLRAADVELRAAGVLREVQRDALDADEVVAAGEGGGEGEGYLGFVWGGSVSSPLDKPP